MKTWDKVKATVLLILVFTYVGFVMPVSLDVSGYSYHGDFRQLKLQYKWLTFDEYEHIYWMGSIIFNIRPGVTCAFIDAESWGNPNAVSKAGAIGLMQVMPYMYARVMAAKGVYKVNKWDLRKPNVCIFVGLTILNSCMKRAKGNIMLAAKYYNAGNKDYFNWPYIDDIMRGITKTYPETPEKEIVLNTEKEAI